MARPPVPAARSVRPPLPAARSARPPVPTARLTSGGAPRLLAGLVRRARSVLDEFAKFGTVGAVSFTLDVAVFNVLLHLAPDRPLVAKSVSTVLAATNAFVLNRHWSFRRRTRSTVRREAVLFAAFNAVGLAIALSVLAASRYVLGLSGPLADNLAANGVGLALGSAFRFWAYRRFVWTAPAPPEVPGPV